MIERMIHLIREMDTCVLATLKEGKPYCSLMAYFPDKSGKRIYMITDKGTTKYANIRENPHVGLLIDTREMHGKTGRSETQALTVSGTCRVVPPGPERKEALEGILARHPEVGCLAGSPDAEVLCVEVSSLLLLEGIDKSYFEEL